MLKNFREGNHYKYDFVYIDASHIAKEVLMDTVLACELLMDNGILIFDDYDWEVYKNFPSLQPKTAIEGFFKFL